MEAYVIDFLQWQRMTVYIEMRLFCAQLNYSDYSDNAVVTKPAENMKQMYVFYKSLYWYMVNLRFLPLENY